MGKLRIILAYLQNRINAFYLPDEKDKDYHIDTSCNY